MTSPHQSADDPAIDPSVLARALVCRQTHVSGLRLVKLAYLAEVRYLAAYGTRLTRVRWRSWKFGPDSRELISSVNSLPEDQVRSATKEVLGHDARYYSPGPSCRPTLEPELDQFFDDLLAVYGSYDTTFIVSAAYRSTPFQRTPAAREIDLEGWARSFTEAARSDGMLAHVQEGLASDRQSFRNARELVEFLAAGRAPAGVEA